MKRRILLISSDKAERTLVTTQLQSRFRSLDVFTAETLNKAHQTFIEHGCDIILSSLHLPDGESPPNVAHSLMAMAHAVPVIVLTKLTHTDDDVLDVLTIGVRHVLFCEDLKSEPVTLINAVIEGLREVNTREAQFAGFGERLQMLSQKVYDVDNRMATTEGLLSKLTTSINTLVTSIDKRGGLEDRVVKLENTHATAIKFGLSFVGICGTVIAGLIVHMLDTFKK